MSQATLIRQVYFCLHWSDQVQQQGYIRCSSETVHLDTSVIVQYTFPHFRAALFRDTIDNYRSESLLLIGVWTTFAWSLLIELTRFEVKSEFGEIPRFVQRARFPRSLPLSCQTRLSSLTSQLKAILTLSDICVASSASLRSRKAPSRHGFCSAEVLGEDDRYDILIPLKPEREGVLIDLSSKRRMIL